MIRKKIYFADTFRLGKLAASFRIIYQIFFLLPSANDVIRFLKHFRLPMHHLRANWVSENLGNRKNDVKLSIAESALYT